MNPILREVRRATAFDHLAGPSQKQPDMEQYCTDNTGQGGVKSRLSRSNSSLRMLLTLLLDIEKPPAQGRGSFSSHGLHLPLLARWTRNNAPFRFVRATMRNDEHQKVAALGAFERQHLVPCGNRGDRYDDPFDIASDALGLGIIHDVVL